ncbi:sodium/proline symporter PutP [Brevibacillus agri]|uniref:sodium/proline symporter PutP n=1 Tax=Brevibacillus agri TaxID=51101 RepID=UPI0004717880|nr:sodium/proline symporter PutP [Brevibacillus agri]MED4571571.1 sodium/proline symporter PutP [Brevibacillus agri]
MGHESLIVFIAYFAMLLFIGYLAYRKTKNFDDYILGGRSLGPFVGGISTGASDMSGWLLLGMPGAIYAGGLSGIWLAVGLAIGAYINWQFVGKRIRIYTEVANNSITFPDFLENRYHDKTKSVRIISALFILIFFAFYVSSGLVGGAILFEKTFGFSYESALLVGSLIIVAYTFIGGFLAVAWTDFLQGSLMFLALVTVPVVAFTQLGGWDETVQKVGDVSPAFLDVFQGTTTLGIISLLGWGVGYFGQPHVIVRFMAFRTSRDIRIGRFVYNTWNVIALFGAIFTGFTGIAYYMSQPLSNPETVFIAFAQTIFNPWITGLLLVAILSAIMSTISSQLIVSASALSEDLYKGFIRKHASQKELVWVSRLSVVAIALFATLLAFNPNSSVLNLVGYAWAGFGAVFGPAVLLSIFWKKTTRNGVLAGMIVGGVTVILWSLLSTPPVGADGTPLPQSAAVIPFQLYELVPGFVLSLLAIVFFSKVGAPPSKEVLKEFEYVKSISA